jgi:hypothetical protein
MKSESYYNGKDILEPHADVLSFVKEAVFVDIQAVAELSYHSTPLLSMFKRRYMGTSIQGDPLQADSDEGVVFNVDARRVLKEGGECANLRASITQLVSDFLAIRNPKASVVLKSLDFDLEGMKDSKLSYEKAVAKRAAEFKVDLEEENDMDSYSDELKQKLYDYVNREARDDGYHAVVAKYEEVADIIKLSKTA